jgi:hypothetical protein
MFPFSFSLDFVYGIWPSRLATGQPSHIGMCVARKILVNVRMIEPHAECLLHFGRRLARWTKIKKLFEDVIF